MITTERQAWVASRKLTIFRKQFPDRTHALVIKLNAVVILLVVFYIFLIMLEFIGEVLEDI